MKKTLILTLVFSLVLTTAASAGLYDLIKVPVASQATTAPNGQVTETFVVPTSAAASITAQKAAGAIEVAFNLGTPATNPEQQLPIADVTIPASVLTAAAGMTITVTTPSATLQLPPALVTALAASGKALTMVIDRTETLAAEQAKPKATETLGSTTEITTPIKGLTKVTIPMGLSLPSNATERAAFLANLAMFAMHSDGEEAMIYGLTFDIDTTINPPLLVSVSFNVDKFSKFTLVKLTSKTMTLTVNKPGYIIDNVKTDIQASYYKGNDTMMPVRMLQDFGVNYQWNEATKTATMTYLNKEIKLTIGSTDAYINNVKTSIIGASGKAVAPELAPGRTMIPLRFVSEGFGLEVLWAPTHEIAIFRR